MFSGAGEVSLGCGEVGSGWVGDVGATTVGVGVGAGIDVGLTVPGPEAVGVAVGDVAVGEVGDVAVGEGCEGVPDAVSVAFGATGSSLVSGLSAVSAQPKKENPSAKSVMDVRMPQLNARDWSDRSALGVGAPRSRRRCDEGVALRGTFWSHEKN